MWLRDRVLSTLGLIDAAIVVLGSVLDGELRVLREIPVPPDRQPADLRAIRDTVGKERFAELLAVGARMSYDEILDHIVAALQGARVVTSQPPSGTVTFLFTDIEGSTRLWEDTTEEIRDLVRGTRRALPKCDRGE